MGEPIDLSPWGWGGFVNYPKLDLDSVGLSFEAPIPEEKNRKGTVTRQARPVAVRLTGPIAGVRVWTDPDRLRAEAQRMLNAADLLAEIQEATATSHDHNEGALSSGLCGRCCTMPPLRRIDLVGLS